MRKETPSAPPPPYPFPYPYLYDSSILQCMQIRELQGKLLNLKIKIKKLISVIYPRQCL